MHRSKEDAKINSMYIKRKRALLAVSVIPLTRGVGVITRSENGASGMSAFLRMCEVSDICNGLNEDHRTPCPAADTRNFMTRKTYGSNQCFVCRGGDAEMCRVRQLEKC